MPERDSSLLRAYRLILGLAGTAIGLSAVLAILVARRSDSDPLATALQDPELRAQVISRLVAENQGQFDSHADADVGRIHLPNLRERKIADDTVSTNRFGLRERDYALPKPEGVVRVVLLGDSMVHGLGVTAEDRLGVFLERWLKERVPELAGRIECLHLGAVSWNFRAEAAYLRRQLSDLDPDLVIHIAVPNDVDDAGGARGFGAMAGFSPQVRERADGTLVSGSVQRLLGHAASSRGLARIGYLRLGIDWESRSRYTAAATELRRLARAVEDAGGRYLLLCHHRPLLPVVWQRLGRHLDPGRVVYLSRRFGSDRRYTVSRSDPHWNREGHARMARLIYGLITRDGLLPALDLPPWDEASRAVEEIADAGRREAERDFREDRLLELHHAPQVAASLDFDHLDAATAAQIHGGLDRDGLVSPYASFLLRNDGGRQLRIDGRALPRPELDGARVRVYVDAEQVGELEIRADTRLAEAFPLPRSASERRFLSVRFEADDYVYRGSDLQHCVVFRLHRIAIES